MKSFLQRLIRDPLGHFIAIGVILFACYSLLQTPEDSLEEANTIVVSEEALLTYLQYRSRAFDKGTFQERLRGMSVSERVQLIDDFVRDEVLFREAAAIGLDRNDAIIRQRINQRMAFALEGLVSETLTVDEERLNAYFNENIDSYLVEASIDFSHVFFSSEKRGKKAAQEAALEILAETKANELDVEEVLQSGDRFAYFTHYVERTPDFVASHFGDEFSDGVFSYSDVPAKGWIGPLESSFGFHMVFVHQQREARQPALEEVRDRVHNDAYRALLEDRRDRLIAELVAKYEVVRTFEGAR